MPRAAAGQRRRRKRMTLARQRLLVTGAEGQVGSEVTRLAADFAIEAVGRNHAALDITAPAAAEFVAQGGFDAVVNLAAYTAVDKAEAEPERAIAANRDGPARLAAACARAGIPLLHVSTDYVFDGAKSGAYLETDPTGPLSVYGRSKAEGETAIRENLERHLILRSAWIFGLAGSNFVKTMLRLGNERPELRVVADQRGCPTAAADLAETILRLAQEMRAAAPVAWGTYHYAGTAATTWHGFATAIFEIAEPLGWRRPSLVAIGTEEYPTPARRPANSVLDCTRIRDTFGIERRPWLSGLEVMLAELRRSTE